EIAGDILVSLSGSFQTTPSFFLNPANGVNYSLVTQAPQYAMQSLDALRTIPLSSSGRRDGDILADYATIHRGTEMAVVNHYNIRRVLNVFASVQDRGLGAVGKDVEKIIQENEKLLPRGSTIYLTGQL